MADRPILFSAPMIRALLDGRKTQTRRILKPQPLMGYTPDVTASKGIRLAKGDRLWVRESFWVCEVASQGIGVPFLVYDDEWTDGPGAKEPKPAELRDWVGTERFGKRPGIHMPRWASRLTLTVSDVRVERLTDISEIDAMAEGIIRCDGDEVDAAEFSAVEGGDIYSNAVEGFEALWNRINGALAWRANPWVVAVTFAVERRNIDSEPMPYLIWSNFHGAWWGPNRAGYYTELASAGRYTREEAIEQCANGRDGFTAKRTPPELPVREIDALNRGNRSIDDLVLKEDRAECRARDLSRKAKVTT